MIFDVDFMPDEAVDQILRRVHWPEVDTLNVAHCARCGTVWPCSIIKSLDRDNAELGESKK